MALRDLLTGFRSRSGPEEKLGGWGREEEKVVALEPAHSTPEENVMISCSYWRHVYGAASGALVAAHRRQI